MSTTTCARPGCTRPPETRGYCDPDYRRRIRMGLHGWRDAGCARAHVLRLRELGWTWEQISEAAGLSAWVPLRVGDGSNKRVRTETERALLAVPLQPHGSHRGTDSTGTRRRVQALAWMGWPAAEVARRAGTTQGTLQTLIQPTRRISYELALRVARVYDELCMTPGPSKHAAGKARGFGFAPPLAWGEDIDDPAATPDLGEKAPRVQAVAEDAAELMALGHPVEVVADRLGVTRDYINKALRASRTAQTSTAA